MDVTIGAGGNRTPGAAGGRRITGADVADVPMDPHDSACIEACHACAIECASCFAHMVGQESHNACPACCIECAEACRWCADAIARNSPFAQQVRELCADICDWCAEQCADHDMPHCQRCAESCLRCAAACRAIAA